MPKKAKELSAVEVKRLSVPGIHPVGGVAGLNLRIYGSGARCWVFRTRVGGKRRDIGLGGFPTVTLAQARNRARATLEQLWRGDDPIAERRERIAAKRAADAKHLTFAEAARNCHAAKEPEFRNVKHRKDWISSLQRYVFPSLGDILISEIQIAHVLQVLGPIWKEKTETATRVRQRMESVITWATVSGYREGENPARWSGNLEVALPAPNKVRQVTHHKALPWQEIPAFIEELRQRQGVAALALEFAVLTAARSGEVRGACWDEFDLEKCIWTVPGGRIKAGKNHRVPLSNDALDILKRVPRMMESPLVFPAPRGRNQLSDMTLSAVLRRMEIEATVHGFRSSFKDWARVSGNYPDEVSELALAHVSSDSTRSAYARDELLAARRKLMADWACFCNAPHP